MASRAYTQATEEEDGGNMRTLRATLWIGLMALMGVGAADTASALDGAGDPEPGSPDAPTFRVCAPPVTIGSIEACSIPVG